MNRVLLVIGLCTIALLTTLAIKVAGANTVEQRQSDKSASDQVVSPPPSHSPVPPALIEPMQKRSQSPLESSDAGPAVDALQRAYDAPATKKRAVVDALVHSGPPSSLLARNGSAMGKTLLASGAISDWNCFRAGCYMVVAEGAPQDLTPIVLKARAEAESQFILALTPELPPNKLVILLNYSQDPSREEDK